MEERKQLLDGPWGVKAQGVRSLEKGCARKPKIKDESSERSAQTLTRGLGKLGVGDGRREMGHSLLNPEVG